MDAAGGFEGRAPGSGARDGFLGAWDAGANAAVCRGGEGAVVAGCMGARCGGTEMGWSVDDVPTPDCSS